MKKPFFILIALAVGLCFPEFERFQAVIRYFLMTILFFSFLKLKLSWRMYQWKHLYFVLASIGLSLSSYFLLLPFHEILAQSLFLVALAPTAIAAIIFADLFRVDLAFVTAAVIVSNLLTIVTIPFSFTYIIETAIPVSVGQLLGAVAVTIVVPLVASQILVLTRSKAVDFFNRIQWFPFILFCINIFIASAKASHFLRYESDAPWVTVVWIVVAMLLLCIVGFEVGKRVGGDNFRIEGSLALGRKNTMFTIWLATTYLQPIILIAPTAYILIQNVYNAWQLARVGEE
jgi:BASS family bile acid:Na+ symporter